MIGSPHIITQGDAQRGLPALAAQLLGSQDLWPSLVALNGLQPPYLTLDPIEALGVPLAQATLPSGVLSGVESITVPGLLASQWQAGFTAALAQAGATGLTSEALTIESYIGTTLSFASALQNPYLAGASLLLYGPQPAGSAAVLLPGSVLYLPITTATFVLAKTAQLSDVFGSDLQGPVAWSGGDLAIVSGVQVLSQRMRAAILTQRGTLPQAPQFGCRLDRIVGAPPGTTQWRTWVRQALLQLPEVVTASGVAAVPAPFPAPPGTVFASASVQVQGSQAPLLLSTAPLTLPL